MPSHMQSTQSERYLCHLLVKKELHHVESKGIIEKLTQPTEWCIAMPVLKELLWCLGGKTQALKYEKYVLPTVEKILSAGSNVFTSLDAASGLCQIPLHENSKKLIFITPFGRYAFCHILFEIKSMPEIFQRKMTETSQDSGG